MTVKTKRFLKLNHLAQWCDDSDLARIHRLACIAFEQLMRERKVGMKEYYKFENGHFRQV